MTISQIASVRAGATARTQAAPRLLALPAAFVAIAPLALLHSGYFPTAWGWDALALLAVTGVVLLVRVDVRLQKLEIVTLASAAALFLWFLLSALWAPAVGAPIGEAERMLVYAAGLAAMFVVMRRAGYCMFLSGVWFAITAVSCYSLATRLFPGWRSTFDSFAVYRLSEPIGYWNGLAIFAAVGILLAFGLAARAQTLLARGIAAGSLPFLATTLYFTYSRGAWLALVVGCAVAIAADSRRLQLVTSSLVLGAFAATAVALASRSSALTHLHATRAAAAHDGHRLALELLILALGAAAGAAVLASAERRVAIPALMRRVYGMALLAVLVAAIVFGVGHYGGPAAVARKTYHSINASPVSTRNLNHRLFTLSSNGRIGTWRVAWREYRTHRWLGTGAGTFEQYWMKYRRTQLHVRNAHNLYLETLATTGPVGLALLLVMLGAPLVAALKTRRARFVPVAAGAYVAFLTHAAIDWDWQLPAVTLAALACGAAMLVRARGELKTYELGMRVRIPLAAAALVLFAAAFVGLRGNLALAASSNAAVDRNWAESASEARAATTWAPWSSDPWRQLGEAQYAQAKYAAARTSFRKAIAKDPQNWLLWADLASVSKGKAFRAAAEHALRLNPLAPELAGFRAELWRKR